MPQSPARPRRAVPAPVARAALGLRRGLQAAADRVVPASVVVLDRTVQDAQAAVLAEVARLGVADALADGPRSAVELAEPLGVDADLLHRALRLLALGDVFRLRSDGRFALTRLSRALRSDTADSVLPFVRYWGAPSTRAAWAELPEVLRTGGSGFAAAHGATVWEHFAAHPDEGAVFAAAMRRATEVDAPDILAAYAWPASGRVCDLAGGTGTLLAAILTAHPDLAGVLVDAPAVLAEAEPRLRAAGLADRVERVPGDLFTGVPVEADLHLLKHVLHDWDDAAAARILEATWRSMRPGSTLLVMELLQERDRPVYPASISDVQMAVVCEGGRERSADELRALLVAAGFVPGALRRTGTGLGVLAASR